MYQLIALLFGYLLGGVPFGYIIVKASGMGDVRKIGSKSTGATNVLRTGKKWLAALTLALDFLKAAAAYWIAEWIVPGAGILAGAAAVVGHCFPVWLKFKGGKGFASTLGFLFAVSPLLWLICSAIWLIVAFATKISSVAALFVLAAAPSVAWFLGQGWAVVFAIAFLSLLGIIRHRENIKRLASGTESKIKL
ncbi:MAG: glycerol-3-phosphate 1-O-acyltransferase PlsY [Rickettsiales bacterium]|jgi:glycerol-3-phosphate acyltransferase PlsY|nr:glycerol-3-phosphate 1-O-acyltransferase PlsY [Rickettsiales bacterium]